MTLKHSYTLIAPFYDAFIAGPSARAREENLGRLPREGGLRVLINGIGTGLDLPYLPRAHCYTGVDLTPAMLRQAESRRDGLCLDLVQGDSLALPFADESFDHAVLHLILAVVPQPLRCLGETARVLKPGGSVLIFDKFLRPGQAAPLRRLLSPLSARMATRLDVVFEEVLAGVPGLQLESDTPALAGGWFRTIRLVKL
jgi:ubiquinone/menaquinone biosynthesis C-methylase UbiE